MVRLLAIAALVAALVAGCGDDDGTASAPTPTATASPTATPKPVTKPKVHVPSGKAPRRLVVRDLRKGTGPVATAGSTVTVHYVGVHFKGGKQFDASWDGGQPFSFALGGGQVIAGWDKGIVGMRVGGRRMLIIPPSLGYGPQGNPPVIKPNETLVFVVDLLGVQ